MFSSTRESRSTPHSQRFRPTCRGFHPLGGPRVHLFNRKRPRRSTKRRPEGVHPPNARCRVTVGDRAAVAGSAATPAAAASATATAARRAAAAGVAARMPAGAAASAGRARVGAARPPAAWPPPAEELLAERRPPDLDAEPLPPPVFRRTVTSPPTTTAAITIAMKTPMAPTRLSSPEARSPVASPLLCDRGMPSPFGRQSGLEQLQSFGTGWRS